MGPLAVGVRSPFGLKADEEILDEEGLGFLKWTTAVERGGIQEVIPWLFIFSEVFSKDVFTMF